MKTFMSYLMAGLIGGIAVLTGSQYFKKSVSVEPSKENFIQRVNESPEIVTGPDFTLAADKALGVVVQINATESQKLAQQKQNEQLRANPFFQDLRQYGFDFPYFGGYMPRSGSGSGVIVSNDGYIVTNNHVVEFADEIEVILKNDKKYKAKKIGTDPRTDLAVLKIEETNLPVLVMGNSDNLKIGEWVLAVGNPFGYLTSTVTAGIVSAKGRNLDLPRNNEDNQFGWSQRSNPSNSSIEEFIQTDAAVNPGNSGGALVDIQGRLVGINSAIASKTGYFSGYSFAIPVNLMNKIVNELINNGKFERGRLGVQVSNIDEESMKTLNLSSKNGVVIESVEDNSSAKYAGLLPQDVIIGINGKQVKDFEDLTKMIGLSKVDETIKVKLIRSGQEKEINVKIRRGL
ncbi:MAG: trypsin-like peptidase domain-containing protein [Saprospiraceae bacterium]|nr:trypsin-like peptidase domain-containing protein [Saprospiraceae bacterium]